MISVKEVNECLSTVSNKAAFLCCAQDMAGLYPPPSFTTAPRATRPWETFTILTGRGPGSDCS